MNHLFHRCLYLNVFLSFAAISGCTDTKSFDALCKKSSELPSGQQYVGLLDADFDNANIRTCSGDRKTLVIDVEDLTKAKALGAEFSNDRLSASLPRCPVLSDLSHRKNNPFPMILAEGEIEGSYTLAVAFDVTCVNNKDAGLLGSKYQTLKRGKGCMMVQK